MIRDEIRMRWDKIKRDERTKVNGSEECDVVVGFTLQSYTL